MTRARFLKRLLVACVWVLVCFVAIGFAGRVFGPGDSAAILRPQVGALLLALSGALWWTPSRRAALAALGAGLIAVVTALSSLSGADRPCTDNCLILYQKNLLSKAWPRYPLADDIIASGAQVVTLQEVSAHNRTYMAALFDQYPRAVICPFRASQDVAVLSSLPAVEGSAFCLSELGMAGVQLRRPQGQTFWAISVHLHWPYPFAQQAQSRRVAEHLAGLDGPVLIAGDFNMVPWGASVHKIAGAVGNRRLRGIANTFRAGGALLPLPIDMVLVPDKAWGSIARRPLMGSDHFGILARIHLGAAG